MRKVHSSMKSLKKDMLCISKLHTKFSKDVCAMIFSAGFVFYGHFFLVKILVIVQALITKLSYCQFVCLSYLFTYPNQVVLPKDLNHEAYCRMVL